MDTFNIVKFINSPTKVTLQNNKTVYKQDKVFVPEYEGFVRCAPYDNHFTFEVPKDIQGPAYLCSCGSAAIFVGSKAYGHLGSHEGMMLVCKRHLDTNKHADGSS